MLYTGSRLVRPDPPPVPPLIRTEPVGQRREQPGGVAAGRRVIVERAPVPELGRSAPLKEGEQTGHEARIVFEGLLAAACDRPYAAVLRIRFKGSASRRAGIGMTLAGGTYRIGSRVASRPCTARHRRFAWEFSASQSGSSAAFDGRTQGPARYTPIQGNRSNTSDEGAAASRIAAVAASGIGFGSASQAQVRAAAARTKRLRVRVQPAESVRPGVGEYAERLKNVGRLDQRIVLELHQSGQGPLTGGTRLGPLQEKGLRLRPRPRRPRLRASVRRVGVAARMIRPTCQAHQLHRAGQSALFVVALCLVQLDRLVEQCGSRNQQGRLVIAARRFREVRIAAVAWCILQSAAEVVQNPGPAWHFGVLDRFGQELERGDRRVVVVALMVHRAEELVPPLITGPFVRRDHPPQDGGRPRPCRRRAGAEAQSTRRRKSSHMFDPHHCPRMRQA